MKNMKSRAVTVVDGVDVVEVEKFDEDGRVIETTYFVQGAKCTSLSEARRLAGEIASGPR